MHAASRATGAQGMDQGGQIWQGGRVGHVLMMLSDCLEEGDSIIHLLFAAKLSFIDISK